MAAESASGMAAESPGALTDAPPAAAAPAARRRRRLPWISLGIVAAFVVAALFAPWLSPADPYEQTLRLRFRPPAWLAGGTWAHPLGTDRLGRDLLSRILHGARVSLSAGVVTVLIASAFGAAVGLTAGYYRGRVDGVL